MHRFSSKSFNSLTFGDMLWQTVPYSKSLSTESSVADSHKMGFSMLISTSSWHETRKPSWSKGNVRQQCVYKDPWQIILSSSMLPVDFLLMVNSIRGGILLIVYDILLSKEAEIAIPEDIVMQKRSLIRSRSSKVTDFGTNQRACTHSYQCSITTLVISCTLSEIWRLKDDRQRFLQQVSKKQFRTLYHDANTCG